MSTCNTATEAVIIFRLTYSCNPLEVSPASGGCERCNTPPSGSVRISSYLTTRRTLIQTMKTIRADALCRAFLDNKLAGCEHGRDRVRITNTGNKPSRGKLLNTATLTLTPDTTSKPSNPSRYRKRSKPRQ